jgi:transposase
MSQERPDELKIIVLDNGAFHKAKKLVIPENIALIFLPAYSPELNPAEKMWAQFKRSFTNRLFTTLDEVSEFIVEVVKNVTNSNVMSTCRYDYIFTDYWTI